MAASPVVARWELSLRLAARRKELGLDVKAITDGLGFTRNYWSAVENDRTLLAADKLRQVCDILDFSDTDRDELLQLREDARQKGWWDEFPSLDETMKRFYGMEAGATQLRVYDGHIISGILQVEEYTRAMIASHPATSPIDVDRLVSLRQRRQDHLFGSSQIELVVLLSEAALRQQVAGRSRQAAQLHHVKALANETEAQLTVRVLPFDVYPGAIVNSMSVSFLRFEDRPHLPAVAWQEGVQLVDGVDESDKRFRGLELAWQVALDNSLDREASIRLVDKIRIELEDG